MRVEGPTETILQGVEVEIRIDQAEPIGLVAYKFDNGLLRFAVVVYVPDIQTPVYLIFSEYPNGPQELPNYDCGAYTSAEMTTPALYNEYVPLEGPKT